MSLSLFHRLAHIEQTFETLTDRTHLTQDAISQSEACEIYKSDLERFKRIIERGGSGKDAAKFKPPNGYRILDFLTLLSNLQEEKFVRDCERGREEMNGFFKLLPPEKQEEFKAWMKKPKIRLTFLQTVQLFENE